MTSTPLTVCPAATATGVGVDGDEEAGGAGLAEGDGSVEEDVGDALLPAIKPRPPHPTKKLQKRRVSPQRHMLNRLAPGGIRTPVLRLSCNPSITIQELTLVR